ncbi:citrate/sodium symporter CitS [Endozoicomonadaceae bacterium StTr2]
MTIPSDAQSDGPLGSDTVDDPIMPPAGLWQKVLQFELYGMPAPVFLLAFITIALAHTFDLLPKNLIGALAIMFVIGGVFGEIGKRLPFWNRYIGGAPVLIFLGTAWLVYAGILSNRDSAVIEAMMQDYKFLDLFIAVLITGSILPINRRLLLRSLIGYIPAILASVAGAMALGVLAGWIFGIDSKEIISLYVLPIMGGGNGAGAIPMAEIYEATTGYPREQFYSVAISILTIANIIAILSASLLDRLGKHYPSLTGEGQLVQRGALEVLEDEPPRRKLTTRDLVAGLALAVTFYVLAIIFAKVIFPGWGDVKIHPYAYMVLLIAVVNATGFVPAELKEGSRRVADFFSVHVVWLLMVGVGVAYTDLGEIIAALSLTNIAIATLIVVGAILGAALGGKLFGFYPIDSAITAGLCMANRGGTGDLEVLAASNRMSLLCYAQISSRMGGGIILVIASIVFGMQG